MISHVKITLQELQDMPEDMSYRGMLFDKLKEAGFSVEMTSLTGSKFKILDEYEEWVDWRGDKHFLKLNGD